MIVIQSGDAMFAKFCQNAQNAAIRRFEDVHIFKKVEFLKCRLAVARGPGPGPGVKSKPRGPGPARAHVDPC